MAYRELADGKPMTEILDGSPAPSRPRRHFWDGEAMGRRGWFWSLFGLLGTVATYSLVLILVAALLFTVLATYNPDVFMALDDQEVEEWVTQSFTGGGGLVSLAFVFGALAVLIPFVWGNARLFQSWSLGDMISVTGRLRWRLLGKATLAGILAWLGMGAIDLSLGFMVERTLPTYQGFSMAWLWVFLFIAPLVVLQSSAEELVFRGYLPQSLHHMLPGLLKQPILIALISSALFAALHWGNPDVMHAPWIAMAEFFVLSLAVSWLSLRLGGLEAAFALHSVNNCMLLLFFSPAAFALGDQVLFTVPIDEDFGLSWWHWGIQAAHLVLTFALFWVIGLWRQSPLSLAVEVERQRQAQESAA